MDTQMRDKPDLSEMASSLKAELGKKLLRMRSALTDEEVIAYYLKQAYDLGQKYQQSLSPFKRNAEELKWPYEEGRKQGLEEAERIAKGYVTNQGDSIAEAIRKLKEKS